MGSGGRHLLPSGKAASSTSVMEQRLATQVFHIYVTSIAKGDGRPRVYLVEPLGDLENDPNVTDEKFPGRPTRSYRSTHALRVVGELEDWERHGTEFIQALCSRVEAGMGEIIN
ncbi:NAD(+)--rifampin ADP-ribosyltransferase [Roseateles sp. 22389]|uniref:NAD(+)--rifampin ADP-ribosyltransferase n=1 Tax=Roseateles sp. 22389 TaxID=3453916 RepID=UPI003F844BE8